MTDIVDLTESEESRPVGRPKKAAKDKMSFVKDNHAYDKAIKKASKRIEDMMDVLAGIAEDKDADKNVRVKAATDYGKLYTAMVEGRAKQQMADLIAEYRIAGRAGNFTAAEDDTPELAFGEIAEEFRSVQNVEYKELDKD